MAYCRRRLGSLVTLFLIAHVTFAAPQESQQTVKKEKTRASNNVGGTEAQPVSHEDVLRPLENMADRFLRSQTAGVFDLLTARAIEGIARLVDGAGQAMVTLVDRLPSAIDRAADTMDEVVRRADNIGKEVAVMVTAPARVVMAGLDRRDRPNRLVRRPNTASTVSLNAGTPAFSIGLPVLPDFLFDNTASNFIPGSSDDLIIIGEGVPANEVEELELQLEEEKTEGKRRIDTIEGSVVGEELERDTRSSPHHTQAEENQTHEDNVVEEPTERIKKENNNKNRNSSNIRRRRPPFPFLSSLNLGINRRRNPNEPEREKNVFERNFENSKTQQSILKLEEEFGGFLGRLIGSVYKNVDDIDASLSQGIMRVIGDVRRSNSSDSRNPTRRVKPTPTTTQYPFRLSFDDVEPAAVKNTVLHAP